MNKTEALAMVDAYLNDIGYPTYSQLIAIAQEAMGLAVWHVPASDKVDSAAAARCQADLAVFANMTGREQ